MISWGWTTVDHYCYVYWKLHVDVLFWTFSQVVVFKPQSVLRKLWSECLEVYSQQNIELWKVHIFPRWLSPCNILCQHVWGITTHHPTQTAFKTRSEDITVDNEMSNLACFCFCALFYFGLFVFLICRSYCVDLILIRAQ